MAALDDAISSLQAAIDALPARIAAEVVAAQGDAVTQNQLDAIVAATTELQNMAQPATPSSASPVGPPGAQPLTQ